LFALCLAWKIGLLEIPSSYFILSVAKAISRRKHNNPAVNASIAAMKNVDIVPDGSLFNSEPMNNAATTMQMNKAHVVQSVIAQ
jgi:hypothetical protein